MDPSYKPEQWPGQHTNTAGCPEGEYMKWRIRPIIAGEIAKAAFDHGCEEYGVDILRQRMGPDRAAMAATCTAP